MDEHETDRASQRANMIEQRLFQLSLTSLDTLKHSTAIELRKAQNVMKKRLRKYRERQREIVQSKPESNKDPVEELMRRQMKQRAKSRNSRPMTSPGKLEETERTEIPEAARESDSESDIEIDPSFMIDHQKSKIDLRPKTAMSIITKGRSMEKYINDGRLGTPVRQTRYFDEDELKDRGHFYMQLVQRRISEEKSKLENLDSKVAEFCGKQTIQTMNKAMQAKRKFFMKNSERQEKGNKSSKTKDTRRTKTTNNPSQCRRLSSFSNTIRRSSSLTNGTRQMELNSFRKPSFIATAV